MDFLLYIVFDNSIGVNSIEIFITPSRYTYRKDLETDKMTTTERGIYQGISLPVSLIQETKKHIEKRPQYKGVTEFVREAIREKMTNDIVSEKSKHLISEKELDYKIREVFDSIVNEKIAKQKQKPTIIKKIN